MILRCPECNEPMTIALGLDGIPIWTLVAYSSPLGHNHDDNCMTRIYCCESGHRLKVSKRRRCLASDCSWVGKEDCWCHPGKKVDEWPNVSTPRCLRQCQHDRWIVEHYDVGRTVVYERCLKCGMRRWRQYYLETNRSNEKLSAD